MAEVTVAPHRGEVITEAGRLLMLPADSVIRERDGSLLVRRAGRWACPCGVYPPYSSQLVVMPVEVLWVPEPAQERRSA